MLHQRIFVTYAGSGLSLAASLAVKRIGDRQRYLVRCVLAKNLLVHRAHFERDVPSSANPYRSALKIVSRATNSQRIYA